MEKYRENLVALGHQEHTVRVIVDDVERYVRWLSLQGIPYDRVNLDTVTSYVSFLRTQKVKWRNEVRPMKSTTIRVKVSRAKRWYDFLRKRDYLYHNPFEGLDRIRVPKKLPEFLTESEMDQLLDFLDGPRDLLLCETLYSTGGRISEVQGINLADIDMQGLRVKLIGKGMKERYIPLTPPAIAALKLYLPIRAEILSKAGLQDNPALFVSNRGTRWSIHTMRGRIQRIGILAGLQKHLHPHMFRHSFATHLLNGGANLAEVRDLMGHWDISTTGIYLHVARGQMERAHRQAHPRSTFPPGSRGHPGSSPASPSEASPSPVPPPVGSEPKPRSSERVPSSSDPDEVWRP